MTLFARSTVLNNLRESLTAHAAAVARLYDKWSKGMVEAPWYQDEKILALLDGTGSFHPEAVLEIGSGDGRVLERLASRMPRCQFLAVDVSQVMLTSAKARCARLRNVHFRKGDWIAPVVGRHFDVIIVKNALHLIPDLPNKLKDLLSVSHSRTRLVVVETVSPSAKSRDFIKSLFRIVDKKKIKLNYFTKISLLQALTHAGWKKTYFGCVDQSMSVDDWLKFKVDEERDREAVRRLLSSAPDQIVDEMNIVRFHGHYSMLRRQAIVFLQPKQSALKARPHLKLIASDK